MSGFEPGTVSTILPVLNGEAFLADAIASVRSQTPGPVEIIVVDGGSTDGTAAVAEAFVDVVRFTTEEPLGGGLAAARNTGVRLAAGKLIAFLDADDLWSDDKLALQLGYLEAHPSAEIILGRTQKTRLVGGGPGAWQFEDWAGPELALSMGAGLFRKSVLDKVGAFDESLPFTCDWDWFMRAREMGVEMRTHPETVQFYRRHGANKTEKIDEGNRDTISMLKKSLLRRRKAAGGPATSLGAIAEVSAPKAAKPS